MVSRTRRRQSENWKRKKCDDALAIVQFLTSGAQGGDMTFDEIWESLVRKKPDLDRPHAKAEFTSGALKRLLRQVYEQGQKSSDATNLFGDLFGKRKP